VSAKKPPLLVLEVEKALGRNIHRKLSLNLGLSRVGGTHSEPTSPALSSPGDNSGCFNLKWDDAAGRSKFKAGEYTSVTGQIAPETPSLTPGKTRLLQGSKQETPAFLTPKMQEGQIKKRKATATPSPNEEVTRKRNPDKRVMDRLFAQRGKLSKIVGESYHPRKDLKSVVASLTSLVAQLQAYNTPQENEEDAPKEAEKPKEKPEKVQTPAENAEKNDMAC
jgi:hypothetical protein